MPAGRDYCQWHDPARAEERQRWRAAGGANRSNRQRARRQLLDGVMTLAEIDAALCLALKDVLAGRIEPGVATAAASVSKAITGVRQVGEMQAQIDELKARAGIEVA